MDVGYLIKEANYYRKLNGLTRAGKKFLLSQTTLKKIVNTKFYNSIYQRKIKKKVAKIRPFNLQIENTNLCNAKCVMCPHTIMKRKAKIMSQKDFEKIVDNAMSFRSIKRLTLTGFGEPFCDRGIIKKIEYVNRKYPQIKIDIYTNASLLDEKIARELIKTKVDRITFSINGTEKNYRNIMGLNYDNTRKNVLFILKLRKEMKKPFLANVSLMILKENERDINSFINFWRPYSDSVRVYAPSDWAGTLGGIIKHPSFKNRRWPCFTLWSSITVDVDGNVIMCCRDYESRVKFGNLLKQDIEEIRKSKKFQELLKYQLDYSFSTPICEKCDNSFDSSLDWIC